MAGLRRPDDAMGAQGKQGENRGQSGVLPETRLPLPFFRFELRTARNRNRTAVKEAAKAGSSFMRCRLFPLGFDVMTH